MVLEAGDPAHADAPRKKQRFGGVHPGPGRTPRRRLLSTNKFRELCIKHGPRALEIIMDIAEHGEPDLVRLAAAKFLIERGYGVGVREGSEWERIGPGLPPLALFCPTGAIHSRLMRPRLPPPRAVPLAPRRLRSRRNIGFSRASRRDCPRRMTSNANDINSQIR
jgi:hypothetical protein